MNRLRTGCLLLLAGSLSLSPSLSAQYTLSYSTNGNVITVTGWSGTPVNLTIPDFVTTIGGLAFYQCSSLTSVTIPSSVNSIVYDAFARCTNLANVIIANGVNSVINAGGGAFYDCTSLASVTIPSSFTNIATAMFNSCSNLTSVTIPNSVTSIDEGAFACTRLTSVIIPNSVTNFGEGAFYACTNLTRVFFTGNAPAADGTVFQRDPATLTIYYLPGTSGWSSAFACETAVLWNPTISPANGSFGFLNNQFGFTITGTQNIPIKIAATSNLTTGTWTPLQSCTLTNGSIYFTDANSPNNPSQFYSVQFP